MKKLKFTLSIVLCCMCLLTFDAFAQQQFFPKKTKSFNIQILDNGFILIPYTFYGKQKAEGHFIFDTGAGVHAISSNFYKKINPLDSLTNSQSVFTGFRHNGERLDLKTAKIDSINSFNVTQKQPTICIYEKLNGSGVDGIIGLKWIENTIVSIDFKNKKLIVPSKQAYNSSLKKGEIILFTVKDDRGISLSMFLKIKVSPNTILEAEFDTGTPFNNLLFHNRYLKQLNITNSSKNSNNDTVAAVDELKLVGFSKTLTNQKVTFKDIIYDGLIGAGFFKDKIITIDIKNRRLIVHNPQ